MKLPRCPAVVLLLGSLAALRGQPVDQKPAASPSHGPEAITVQGVAQLVGEKFAAVSLAGSRGDWKKVGDRIGSYDITKITDDDVTFVEQDTKAEFTQHLQASSVKADEPARYSKAWINSKANPMLKTAVELPSDVIRHWGEMTAAEREEIIDYYRKHGWRLFNIEAPNGRIQSYAAQNIYEDERQAAIKENLLAFEAGLDEKQLAFWKSVRSAPPVNLLKPPDRAVLQAQLADQRARTAQFLSMLSPEQRAKYDSRADFTKHDWKH